MLETIRRLEVVAALLDVEIEVDRRDVEVCECFDEVVEDTEVCTADDVVTKVVFSDDFVEVDEAFDVTGVRVMVRKTIDDVVATAEAEGVVDFTVLVELAFFSD